MIPEGRAKAQLTRQFENAVFARAAALNASGMPRKQLGEDVSHAMILAVCGDISSKQVHVKKLVQEPLDPLFEG